MKHSNVDFFFQTMRVSSDETVGMYMGIRGEGAILIYDGARREG